ncbi:hypothetical protein RRF57_004796 [Xylaria bambusicola]|uniref:Uncharacterized protein n=1 Tax=Xylaria bambusicola TaxID=326684 RepID=A0AAN7UPF0_9PEZI
MYVYVSLQSRKVDISKREVGGLKARIAPHRTAPHRTRRARASPIACWLRYGRLSTLLYEWDHVFVLCDPFAAWILPGESSVHPPPPPED